nr:hypothetical protein [uncultured Prevotella sp.]
MDKTTLLTTFFHCFLPYHIDLSSGKSPSSKECTDGDYGWAISLQLLS